MDYFGYFATQAPEAYARERDEMREVISHLRHRYGRRHLFRVADVAEAVMRVRFGETIEDFATPRYVPAADVAPTPKRVEIDLTCDEVIE